MIELITRLARGERVEASVKELSAPDENGHDTVTTHQGEALRIAAGKYELDVVVELDDRSQLYVRLHLPYPDPEEG